MKSYLFGSGFWQNSHGVRRLVVERILYLSFVQYSIPLHVNKRKELTKSPLLPDEDYVRHILPQNNPNSFTLLSLYMRTYYPTSNSAYFAFKKPDLARWRREYCNPPRRIVQSMRLQYSPYTRAVLPSHDGIMVL